VRLEVDMAAVLGTTGITLVVMGVAQVLPAAVALTTGVDPTALLAGAMGTAAIGLALVPLRRRARKWTRRESLSIVALSWVGAILAAAVPYVASGLCGPVDALVESASGLTTTGATIFPEVDALAQAAGVERAPPHHLHLWRALTHWLGGAGIVLVVLVLAPWLGEDAETIRRSQRSEASFLTERYRGSTKATLKGLFAGDRNRTTLELLLLIPLGVHPWDALLHAFATISTGGFSNYTASLGTWGNAVQLVVLAFMVLGALNFAVLGRVMDELAWTYRKARRRAGPLRAILVLLRAIGPIAGRAVWRHGEVRGYLAMLAGVSLFVTAVLFVGGTTGDPGHYRAGGLAGFGQAFVDAAFMVGAISTTTGFGADDYTTWPAACQVTLLGLMVVGGCSGSTAGGIKFRRLMIVLKHALREVRRLPRPRAVLPIKLGDQVVPEEQVREAVGYLTTYVVLIAAIALGVAVAGSDVVSSGGAAVSAMGSIGPGFGDCDPNGSFLPYAAGAKVLLAFGMLLGRLEIYSLLTVVTPSFWMGRRRPPG